MTPALNFVMCALSICVFISFEFWVVRALSATILRIFGFLLSIFLFNHQLYYYSTITMISDRSIECIFTAVRLILVWVRDPARAEIKIQFNRVRKVWKFQSADPKYNLCLPFLFLPHTILLEARSVYNGEITKEKIYAQA